MFKLEYDLSLINNIKISDLLENPSEIINSNDLIIHKSWVKNDKLYDIIKYDKRVLTWDIIGVMGKWRSVIFSNKKLVVFSPPKSLNCNLFITQYRENECIIEEFIEGTMINLFYDRDINQWEIASKSSIGGNIKFFKEQPTFSVLFYEICNELNINFDNFSKDCCYSFVMQHPKNRFVIPIREKKLYLIACYEIDSNNFTVKEFCQDYLRSQNINKENISFPQIGTFGSYSELIDNYASMNTDPNIMGIIIKHKDGMRTKLRNPNYEYIKQLRGNNTKLQYQYLCLRKLDKVKDCLRFFPENSKEFSKFRSSIHNFTENLYSNYIKCYIKKEKSLKEFPNQFRSHMFNLHQIYLSIREERGYINKPVVIDYINKLDSAQLMYSLNYHMRTIIDTNEKVNKVPS
jgi:hypothetical protein